MTLSELIKPDLVLPKIACASKDELITKLAEKVFEVNHDIPFSQDTVLHAIQMREQIGGTMLPSGLSVPHARLREYEGFILALGIPEQPIFHEGIQIRLMSLMISSQSGGNFYLPTLAALTKISRNGEHFTRLCAAENSEDFIRLLREQEPELD